MAAAQRKNSSESCRGACMCSEVSNLGWPQPGSQPAQLCKPAQACASLCAVIEAALIELQINVRATPCRLGLVSMHSVSRQWTLKMRGATASPLYQDPAPESTHECAVRDIARQANRDDARLEQVTDTSCQRPARQVAARDTASRLPHPGASARCAHAAALQPMPWHAVLLLWQPAP